jgi:hypothetical protein
VIFFFLSGYGRHFDTATSLQNFTLEGPASFIVSIPDFDVQFLAPEDYFRSKGKSKFPLPIM